MNKIEQDSLKNILIRSTNWIGDAVMTTPAVRAIRQNFPSAQISILSKPWVSPIFENSKHIDQVFIYDNNNRHGKTFGKLRLAKDLREQRFDGAILLQNAFEAALITFLSGIPIRLGYNTDARSLLLTHRVRITNKIKAEHQTSYYLNILRGAGLKAPDTSLYLELAEKDLNYADKFIKEQISSNYIVGLNPGAVFGPAKQWPAIKYAQLGDMLYEKYRADIIIFGGSGDINTGKSVSANMKKTPINICGLTQLGQAMALIKRCNLFITNDSGLMHVAAALKTPLIAIFGSTNPKTTGPFSDKSKIITKNLKCSPCLKKECPEGHFKCMEQIRVEDIFEKIASFIF